VVIDFWQASLKPLLIGFEDVGMGIAGSSEPEKVRSRVVVQERVLFFGKFLQAPLKIGSVTPSSAWLVAAMLAPIPWSSTGAIVELGAGTGVITREILRRLPPGGKAFIFEQDARLRATLREDYPGFTVEANAEHLYAVIKNAGTEQVDCVVSGLPFTTLPEQTRQAILAGVLQALKPGGFFIAFQYSLHMRARFCSHFDQMKVRYVPLNVPPAFVYCCRKAS
jgi:phospholipid N-methyltransferase